MNVLNVYADELLEQDRSISDISDVKAASANPVGSSSDPYYVKPHSSSGTRYYLTNTGAVSQSNTTIGTFANIVTELTYSLSYDLAAVCSRINALGTTYLGDIETNTGTLIGKLGNVESDVDDIRRYLNVDYYQLITNISNKVNAIAAKSADLGPLVPYFMPDPTTFDYTSWLGTYYRRQVSIDGTYSGSTKSTDSIMVEFADYMYDSLYTSTNLARRLIATVKGESYENADWNKIFDINTGNQVANPSLSLWADIRLLNRYLTHIDANTLRLPSNAGFHLFDKDHDDTSVSPTSVYDWFRLLGTNVSDNLSRLAFVLANDKDIELRESQEGNVNSVTDNLTSGNVSVSSGKIGSVKGIGNDVVNGLSSNADVSDGVAVLSGSSEAWSWFSTATAEAFDSSVNARKGSGYRYLDEYNKVMGNYVGKSAVSGN